MEFSTSGYHIQLAKENAPLYAYDVTKDFAAQKAIIAEKYAEILGRPEKKTDPKPIVEWVKTENPEYDMVRFKFESEPGLFVPCYMMLPKGVYGTAANKKAVICLQGHSSGMHLSAGIAIYEHDQELINGDRDFGVQAVRQGFVAVCMEQRGFGELQGDIDPKPGKTNCHVLSMQALMLGRTIIGERSLDVSQLLDTLKHFPEVDENHVGLMGQSGGGTATFYTSCIEPRLIAAMPSCSFCQNEESIFAMHHCVCNYIPGIQKYFEMADLAVLIAPRPLVIVCGKNDPIFPLSGVKKGFEKVKAIYAAAGAPDNCRLVIGDGEHRFYAEPGWKQYTSMIQP